MARRFGFFGGSSGGSIDTLTDFLDFMYRMRSEWPDFRPMPDWDTDSVLSVASDITVSENAIAEGAASDADVYSPLSFDTVSEGSDYSTFDELFSPGYYSAGDTGDEFSDTEHVNVWNSDEEEPPLDAPHEESDTRADSETTTTPTADARSRSPSPVRRRKRRASTRDVEATRCSICLDSWTAGGVHRVVALQCGHVFGHGCIDKWLRGKSARSRCCPECKVKASLYDMRYLRPTLVSAPEAQRLRDEIAGVARETDEMAHELRWCRQRHKDTDEEVRRLKFELEKA